MRKFVLVALVAVVLAAAPAAEATTQQVRYVVRESSPEIPNSAIDDEIDNPQGLANNGTIEFVQIDDSFTFTIDDYAMAAGSTVPVYVYGPTNLYACVKVRTRYSIMRFEDGASIRVVIKPATQTTGPFFPILPCSGEATAGWIEYTP